MKAARNAGEKVVTTKQLQQNKQNSFGGFHSGMTKTRTLSLLPLLNHNIFLFLAAKVGEYKKKELYAKIYLVTFLSEK